MDAEEALRVADAAVFAKTGRHLKDIEKAIILGAWQTQNYDSIAATYHCEPQHIKNKGAEFWNLLSEALGEKVSKRNFRGALERRSHSAELPQPQEESAEKETVSKNTAFVRREEAIADFTLVNDLDELVRRVREKRYDKIQDQCRTVRILDVEQEIGIDDIYIDVNVLEEIPSYKHKGLSELLKDLKPDEIDRFSYGRHQERLPGLEAVEKHRKLMVLGQPGAGKTTFLQHIAIEYNQSGFQVNCIPIFILLREFTENAKIVKDFSLFNYISREFGCCRISDPDQTLTMLLNNGRALILLDGLDEVPEQDREEVLIQIRKFVRDYCSNRFIITCRIAEGQRRFKNFTNVEIADFTTTQIEKFSQKWFLSLSKQSNREEQEEFQRATQLMKKLKENERILELAATPLLLTLICLVFQPEDDLPAKRSELYEKGMNILLDKWDKDRDIKRDEFYRSLSPCHKVKLLSHVARATFEQHPYYLFEKHIVQRHIADYLGTLPDANPNREELFHDSEVVLQAIGVQHGLLITRAQGIYSFSHRTFQEYFTARKFVDSSEPQALESLVSHISEQRWREVIVLAAELIGDNLLVLMDKEARQYINTPKLRELINWADQVTVTQGSNGCIKPAAKRAAAICLSLVLRSLFGNTISGNIFPLHHEAFDLANKALCFTTLFDYYNYKNICRRGLGLFNRTLHSDWKTSAILSQGFVVSLERLKIFNNVNFSWLLEGIKHLKSQIPKNSNYFEVEMAFRNCILQTWLTAINLNRELINLSMEEAESLGNYIEANHIMLWCKQKQVAVEASPTWERIEKWMLLVD